MRDANCYDIVFNNDKLQDLNIPSSLSDVEGVSLDGRVRALSKDANALWRQYRKGGRYVITVGRDTFNLPDATRLTRKCAVLDVKDLVVHDTALLWQSSPAIGYTMFEITGSFTLDHDKWPEMVNIQPIMVVSKDHAVNYVVWSHKANMGRPLTFLGFETLEAAEFAATSDYQIIDLTALSSGKTHKIFINQPG